MVARPLLPRSASTLPPAQLIDARTVAAADSALAGLAGGLGQEVAALRGECLDILAELEARWGPGAGRGRGVGGGGKDDGVEAKCQTVPGCSLLCL